MTSWDEMESHLVVTEERDLRLELELELSFEIDFDLKASPRSLTI
jgi:hypothetical protein